MTSKNLFFKLMKEDLKRRYWAMGLGFLMFFFGLPVAAAMGATDIANDYADWIAAGRVFESGVTAESLKAAKMANLMNDIVGFVNPWTAFVMICAGLILALTGFNYLHSKRQVDFYHSVPVRRETIFFVRYLNGVLILLVTYLVNLFLALGIFAVNGVGLSESFGPAMAALGIHLIGFLLHYGLMIIAVVMTGNFFISVLGGIVLFNYIPAAAALSEGLMHLFFVTSEPGRRGTEWFMVHGCPTVYYLELLETGAFDSAELETSKIMWAVLAAALLAAAALALFRLRSSEAAGRAMAFALSKPVIKTLLVVPCTIAMGLLFWSIYYSLPWAVFGFLMGLVVSHCVIEIIYHFEFRKLFANLPQMAVCAVLALAVIGIYRFDLTGYDRYVPKESEFQSASVYLFGLEDWNHEYGIPVHYEDGSNSWRYISGDTYAEENMQVTDYETVKKIADQGIAQAKLDKEARLKGLDSSEVTEYTDNSRWTTAAVVYTLKGGKQVYRSYRVDINAARETYDTLYGLSQYKKGVYPILNLTADSIVGVYEASADEIIPVSEDAEFTKTLLETYQRELTALTLSDRAKAAPVTSLRFLTEAEKDYLTMITKSRRPNYSGEFSMEEMEQVNFFPVYPSFTETIDLLKEEGVEVPKTIVLNDVDRIELENGYSYAEDYRYFDDEDWEETETASVTGEKTAWETAEASVHLDYHVDVSVSRRNMVIENDGTPENTEKIREILAHIEPADMVRLNGLQDRRGAVDIKVYLRSRNQGKAPSDQVYASYVFTTDELPKFYQEAIHYDKLSGDDIAKGIGF